MDSEGKQRLLTIKKAQHMAKNKKFLVLFIPVTGQYFAYLIVLDFESTCWKDKKFSYGPEISKLYSVLSTRTGGKERQRKGTRGWER